MQARCPFDRRAASWPYAAYSHIVDYVLLAATTSTPMFYLGRPASRRRTGSRATLDARSHRALAPSRTIVGIGSYGYGQNGGPAADIDLLAGRSGVAAHDSRARISPCGDRDQQPALLLYRRRSHQACRLGSLTASPPTNKSAPPGVYRLGRLCCWKLGTEDPSIRKRVLVKRPYGQGVPAALRTITLNADIDYEGAGRVPSRRGRSVRTAPAISRSIRHPTTSTTKSTQSFPRTTSCASSAHSPGKISLTF